MLALTTLWLLAACDGGGDGDGGVDGGAMDTGVIDAFVPRRDGDLPRCERDEECDDGVACTRDSCGMNGLCRNQVDIASCDDGIFCNGVEQCDTELGCVPGRRQTCNDDDVCTIDRCSEEEKLCEHFPRDLDEDGDPDWFCSGGGDCDDTNSLVSSLINEVCDDGIDNDCDGTVDNGCATQCTRDDSPVVNFDDTCDASCGAPVDGELFVPCGAVVTMYGEHVFSGGAVIEGRVRVQPRTGAVPTAGSLVIDASTITVAGLIDANASGFNGGQGPGTSTCRGSGAGYGGVGGIGDSCTAGGPAYGSRTSRSVELGSGGANGFGDTGGRGGGRVVLRAGTVTVSGGIEADGGRGGNDGTIDEGGGGSGGGILLDGTTRVDVSGVLSARGAAGHSTGFSSAGGAGGRIKLFAPAGTMTGIARVEGGAGASLSGFSSTGGASGTYFELF
ncbi:MAG TPA: hypothetical protein DEF51_55060 [Myxococcales bacterium]|nr:hypothetical protein [Myxococcales bacterium]